MGDIDPTSGLEDDTSEDYAFVERDVSLGQAPEDAIPSNASVQESHQGESTESVQTMNQQPANSTDADGSVSRAETSPEGAMSATSQVQTGNPLTAVGQKGNGAGRAESSDERPWERSPVTASLHMLTQEINRTLEREATLRQRIRELEGTRAEYEALQREMERAGNTLSVTDQQIQEMQDVMEALAEDPNHVLVLNSLARYAPIMLVLISEYETLKAVMQQS